MQKLGIGLMGIGIILLGLFGFQHWNSMQSVTKISGDVIKESNDSPTSSAQQVEEVLNPEGTFKFDDRAGDGIATLVIPSIDLAFDVYMGTDEEALAKGVGMYESQWTTTPDIGGHTVLTGHRDSVFRPVGNLEDGESVYVSYQGEDYEYKINKTWITDAEDRTVIVEKDEPTLTLSTCYPFEFVGSAPDRYIIQAELVQTGDLLDLNALNH